MKERIMLISVIAVITLTGCSFQNKIEQKNSAIELGTKDLNLVDTLNVEPGYNVDVKESSINYDELGTYNVIFQITNSKGKTKNKELEYTVVDTVAPEIIAEDNIEVISGNSFELKDYVKVTDASNNVDLKYSGDVDVTKVGNYPITISAQDVSGNISEKKVNINVITRPDADYKNAKWGDDKETVKKYEVLKDIESEKDNFITYNDNSVQATIGTTAIQINYTQSYAFDINGKLIVASKMAKLENDNSVQYIALFNSITDEYKKKYGAPIDDDGIISNGLFAPRTPEEAITYLEKGLITFCYDWKVNDSNLSVMLTLNNATHELALGEYWSDGNLDPESVWLHLKAALGN